MPKEKKRKRSRSRSNERRRSEDTRFRNMQAQLDNLTSLVVELTRSMATREPTLPKQKNDQDSLPDKQKDGENENMTESATETPKEQNLSHETNKVSEEGEIDELEIRERAARKENFLDLLGEDPTASKEIKIAFDADLQTRWKKWMEDGYPEETKRKTLEKYPRKAELHTEAPMINPEIVTTMTDIGKKRDQHFEYTQNCVGSGISAIGGAISMILNPPEDGVDEQLLLEYLCDAGKLFTDVHHQQTVARKSFITPMLNKSMKPIIDAAKSDVWLYGEKFAERLKEAKTVERACADLKSAEKPSDKNKTRTQGNWKHPPANYRQVGGTQKRPSMKFKQKPYTGRPQPRPSSRTSSQTRRK
ncbi:uncharacterized protein [Neodiprion pinetum]|uniref:uncharacterized protein n=1 Tax=Neodiprion pinetum TaxID=441929 RepID=UPI003724C392